MDRNVLDNKPASWNKIVLIAPDIGVEQEESFNARNNDAVNCIVYLCLLSYVSEYNDAR